MKIKKVLSSLMVCTALVGCSVGGNTTTNTNTTTSTNTTDTSNLKIGVVQLIKHDALDAATQGFVDVLTEEFNLTDDNFNIQIATGQTDEVTSMAASLVQDECDVILANATAALQAASNATTTIPVLGTAITEYGTALGLDDFNGTVGTNVSGTSDLAPLDQQAEMIKELLPDAKNVGILSCSGEPNSAYQVKVVQAALEDLGYNVTSYTFANSGDVASITEQACSENDVLYIPTDNTAASCTETIYNVSSQSKTPIIAGEEGIMTGCGIATLSISYYELGRTTGEMAVKILNGEANVSEMAIEYYDNPVKKYMADRCAEYGITVPDDYVAYEG